MEGAENLIIVGAGVIGLTTANLLQKQYAERNITLVAAEFPTPSPMCQSSPEKPSPTANYASMWAGAHYRPIPYLPDSCPKYMTLADYQQRVYAQLAQEHKWAVRTAEIMKQICTSNVEAGVQIVPAAEYLEDPPPEYLVLKSGSVYANFGDNFRVLDRAQLQRLNKDSASAGKADVKWACEYESYVVNVHAYCAWLLQRFIDHGGRVIQKSLGRLVDALSVVGMVSPGGVVVNCTGLSKNLTMDSKTKIIRGQTILVRQQYHATKTRQCADGTWSFLIPRPLGGGTIIGGTKQIGDTETKPREAEREKLLQNAVKFYPDFVDDVSKFEVVSDNVGRRPWREGGMRIEIESLDSVCNESIKVVHAYGAGGRGYELSWGVAEEICRLVEQCLSSNAKL